ncbi:MAG: 50S ribosomal protein L5, partial [Desulfobaccales bacterium]
MAEKEKKPKAKPEAAGKDETKAAAKAKGKAEAKAAPAPAVAEAAQAGKFEARLWDYYRTECVPRMMQEFRYGSPMQAPRLEKIVINMGLGEAIQNIKLLESASAELSAIA